MLSEKIAERPARSVPVASPLCYTPVEPRLACGRPSTGSGQRLLILLAPLTISPLTISHSVFTAPYHWSLRPRAVRPAGDPPRVRRVRGCLIGNPGPVPPGPGRLRLQASLRAPSGPLGPCSGPWAALRHPRDGVFCSGRVIQRLSKDIAAGEPIGNSWHRSHQHATSEPVRRLLATPVAASGRPVAGKDIAIETQPGDSGDNCHPGPRGTRVSGTQEQRKARVQF
jgi:hypothetical protein